MHGGNWNWAIKKYQRTNFVDLSANINPFGPPPGVWDVLNASLSEITRYPDPECEELRDTVAEKFGIPINNILPGNGAGELIFSIVNTLKPNKVAVPTPSFSEYVNAARAAGAEIQPIPLGARGWSQLQALRESNQQGQVSWSNELRQEIRNQLLGCELLFLCSPHNPTGSTLDEMDILEILDLTLPINCKVLLDESFVDFLPDPLRYSVRKKILNYPNLIVIYSLTKFYSIPGLRLGMLFAQEHLINRCKHHRDPWAVNILAAKAGIAALKDPIFPGQVREHLNQNKKNFYQHFSEANFEYLKLLPTTVNFALIEVLDQSAATLVHRLGKLGILVRDCSDFEDLKGDFIRVAIKEETAMVALNLALQKIYE